ncbi:hypothetical protein FTV88_0248 [Heliorestis convoluta]|uniref:Uncharacterized protein n=1 Tax=Heliorestis convoluta TaxID=356322 RepID=A0A5Q2MVX2_9FIRM|nr:hypothetical protein FTV88_0248 [Heliorestis convoluta]
MAIVDFEQKQEIKFKNKNKQSLIFLIYKFNFYYIIEKSNNNKHLPKK